MLSQAGQNQDRHQHLTDYDERQTGGELQELILHGGGVSRGSLPRTLCKVFLETCDFFKPLPLQNEIHKFGPKNELIGFELISDKRQLMFSHRRFI